MGVAGDLFCTGITCFWPSDRGLHPFSDSEVVSKKPSRSSLIISSRLSDFWQANLSVISGKISASSYQRPWYD